MYDDEWAVALLRSFFAGDTGVALELLGGDVRLDAPRLYPVVGSRGVVEFTNAWPRHYPFEVTSIQAHAAHSTGDASATEVRVALVSDGAEIALPVAVVESVVAGERFVRIYHSERLLTGERKRRRPVFPVAADAQPTPFAEIHPAVAQYMQAIGSGDAGKVLDRFAPGVVVSNGARPVTDRDELRQIYGMMVKTGGVRLVRGHEIVTEDVVVFEYTGLARDVAAPGLRTPPGGGIAVYGYDDGGLVTRVSIFDDFDPDALLAAAAADHES